MPTQDEYIAEARRQGEYLRNINIASPGSSEAAAYGISVLANLALAELPELEPEPEAEAEFSAESEKEQAEKPKKAPAKKK